MKIALVILHADPMRGGAERYTTDLAAALTKRGHEVTLIHGGKPGASASEVTLPAGGLTRTQRYRTFLRSFQSHLEEKPDRYDIIHSMLPVHRCDVYQPHAGIASENLLEGHRKHGKWLARAYAQVRNRLSSKRSLIASIERDMLDAPNPPVVLCLSDQQKKIVLTHYPAIEHRLFRLFNAVDLQRFDPDAARESRAQTRRRLEVSDDQVLALLIAQNWELKGVRQAITALSRVEDRRLVLAVVGKDNAAPYKALAMGLGVSDRLRFPGPTREAPSFYRAADFFVLPTRSDVCSLVVLEALAMGLPVISTAANGACEIMLEGQHGFVLPDPRDSDALAAAMRKLVDSKLRSEMSAACIKLRDRLSYEQHLDTLLEIYKASRG